MVRPKRQRKPRKSRAPPPGTAQLHVLLSIPEDQALADEATRRNCSKSDVIRTFISSLQKRKASKT